MEEIHSLLLDYDLGLGSFVGKFCWEVKGTNVLHASVCIVLLTPRAQRV